MFAPEKLLNMIEKHFYLYVFVFLSFFVALNSCSRQDKSNCDTRNHIYIIGGAHKGERIFDFKGKDIYTAHRWKIVAIEANPFLINLIPRDADTIVLNNAIWIKDGKIKFYFVPESDNLGSVYKKNYSGRTPKPIFVESMDFGQWLKKNFTLDDYIMVSLDIEGSEYDVLRKMVQDRTINYIDHLLVEFHPGIGGVSENDIVALLTEIKKTNTRVERVEM